MEMRSFLYAESINIVAKKQTRRLPRTHINDKWAYGAALADAIADALCGLAYFQGEKLSMFGRLSFGSQQIESELPDGVIIQRYDGEHCRLRQLDNATGEIRDRGVVDCPNTEAHKRE
jgi:hypothetical protein